VLRQVPLLPAASRLAAPTHAVARGRRRKFHASADDEHAAAQRRRNVAAARRMARAKEEAADELRRKFDSPLLSPATTPATTPRLVAHGDTVILHCRWLSVAVIDCHSLD
jgi:hypothetical protein